MTKKERNQLCQKCKEKVNKVAAEYIAQYRQKKRAEAESIKKYGLDVV